jgi:hypothetical protein
MLSSWTSPPQPQGARTVRSISSPACPEGRKPATGAAAAIPVQLQHSASRTPALLLTASRRRELQGGTRRGVGRIIEPSLRRLASLPTSLCALHAPYGPTPPRIGCGRNMEAWAKTPSRRYLTPYTVAAGIEARGTREHGSVLEGRSVLNCWFWWHPDAAQRRKGAALAPGLYHVPLFF